MIFVTVGNDHHKFHRLLDAIHSMVLAGAFGSERVVFQVGHSQGERYSACEIVRFVPMQSFVEYISRARIVVSHGGCGTMLTALHAGVIPVVMPRRRCYGEHINDHQIELAAALYSEGLVLLANEVKDLPQALSEVESRGRVAVRRSAPVLPRLVRAAIEELG